MKIFHFILHSFLIFLISKLYLKGYKLKSKDFNSIQKNNIANIKNDSKIGQFNYNSSYYNNHNITCNSLGSSTWALLHSVSAIYSNHPNITERSYLKDFFIGLMYFYPSNSHILKEILKEHPLEYSNREELIYYMCEIHNILNKRLGKQKFSCKEAFNIWGGDCGCNE